MASAATVLLRLGCSLCSRGRSAPSAQRSRMAWPCDVRGVDMSSRVDLTARRHTVRVCSGRTRLTRVGSPA
eukprot:7383913-Prymnesium_polylepis.1